jgi:hypothetical protein
MTRKSGSRMGLENPLSQISRAQTVRNEPNGVLSFQRFTSKPGRNHPVPRQNLIRIEEAMRFVLRAWKADGQCAGKRPESWLKAHGRWQRIYKGWRRPFGFPTRGSDPGCPLPRVRWSLRSDVEFGRSKNARNRHPDGSRCRTSPCAQARPREGHGDCSDWSRCGCGWRCGRNTLHGHTAFRCEAHRCSNDACRIARFDRSRHTRFLHSSTARDGCRSHSCPQIRSSSSSLAGRQRRMKMGSRWRSVCAAALATE